MPLIYTDTLLRADCPERAGVDTFVLKDFFDELKSSEYSFKNIMILRHGLVAAECTRYPYAAHIPHTMYSFSKAVTTVAIGFALSEGLLRMDTTIAELFGDTYDEKQIKKNEGITVRHLLTMSTGKRLHFINNFEKMDWLENYITSPQSSKPGDKFQYLSENTYVLGRMLAKVSGLTVSEYLKPRFFEPLKIECTHWDKDPNGFDAAGWGLFLTIEDMAKIAQCFVQDGVWNGVQIIPNGWVEAMTTPYRRDLYGLDAKNLGFGFNTWCGREDGYYRLEGLYGQHAFIYPKHDACIVINSSEINHKQLYDLIDKFFPFAFKDNLDIISEDVADEFKAEICTHSDNVLNTSPRNFATEQGLSGNTYSVKTTPRTSLMPASGSYTLCKKPGKLDNLEFVFSDNYGEISWTEKNAGKNTLCVNFDGKRRISRIKYEDMTLHMLSFGAWNADGTLSVQIFTMEMPEVRTWKIAFNDKKIKIKSSITPPMYNSIQNKMRFQGIKTNGALNLAVKIASSVAEDFVYVGTIHGKLKK